MVKCRLRKPQEFVAIPCTFGDAREVMKGVEIPFDFVGMPPDTKGYLVRLETKTVFLSREKFDQLYKLVK